MLKLLEVWSKFVFVNVERSPEIFSGVGLSGYLQCGFLISLMVKGILSGT